MQSAGGVVMSANDAARWLELMIESGRVGGRQIIAPEVIDAVKTPITDVQAEFDGYTREAYALGWYHGPYRDQRLLHHFGGFAGFRAHVSFMPAVGVGVAVFANGNQGGAVTDAVANYVYDRVLSADDAAHRFDAALADGADRRTRSINAINSGRAERAARPWTLTRPRTAYAGAYASAVWGRIEVEVEGDALRVRYGAMQAVGEAFTQPDSIRVELVPGQGEPILFEGDSDQPNVLRTRMARFQRV
jgi:CubicO group peptidase (beta-lactamase class C family)